MNTLWWAILWWAILGIGVALTGCCQKAEKKAAELQAKVDAMEEEMPKLTSRLAEAEPKAAQLETCLEDLESAKARLVKQEQEESLMAKRQETVKRLLDKLKGIIETGDLSVRIRRGRMVLELPSAVMFESGKAELSDKGKKTLNKVAEVLKEIKDRDLQVAGHTDKDRLSEKSAYETNWHLSTARAVAVVIYLREKGVSPKRLSAAGYARYQPVASNKTKRGKARNRRIEITLVPNLDELPDLSRLEKKLGLADTPIEKPDSIY